jgi:hypothetical protein
MQLDCGILKMRQEVALMARYKYGFGINQDPNPIFDQLFSPGQAVPISGIYRCQGCGHEDACNSGDPFPTQNHMQHSLQLGKPILWKLVVGTN